MTDPSPPPGTSQTGHKAWIGGAMAALSMFIGIMLGALQVIAPEDIATAIGTPVEKVGAWFKIVVALLVAVAGAGAATGLGVYNLPNKPKV